MSALDQRFAQRSVAAACPSGAALVGALAVLGAQSGPSGASPGRWEGVDFRFELQQDCAGGAVADTGNGRRNVDQSAPVLQAVGGRAVVGGDALGGCMQGAQQFGKQERYICKGKGLLISK
ncbi:MAG: hypothetical protein OXC26_12660 [Albidovulum sp.]|nr:hypothetical protein [Albidovulum sp.]